MFKEFGAAQSTHGRVQAPGSPSLDQVAELISRYPDLSEIELTRLINLYRELSALDVALMISDQQLAPRLDRFVSEHRSDVKTPFRQYATLVYIAAVGIFVAICGATWA